MKNGRGVKTTYTLTRQGAVKERTRTVRNGIHNGATETIKMSYTQDGRMEEYISPDGKKMSYSFD